MNDTPPKKRAINAIGYIALSLLLGLAANAIWDFAAREWTREIGSKLVNILLSLNSGLEHRLITKVIDGVSPAKFITQILFAALFLAVCFYMPLHRIICSYSAKMTTETRDKYFRLIENRFIIITNSVFFFLFANNFSDFQAMKMRHDLVSKIEFLPTSDVDPFKRRFIQMKSQNDYTQLLSDVKTVLHNMK